MAAWISSRTVNFCVMSRPCDSARSWAQNRRSGISTRHSSRKCLSKVKQRKVGRIMFMCLVAAPEGVRRMAEDHPDVQVFTAALDRELNEMGYILPGLGDAGDRLFGTK